MKSMRVFVATLAVALLSVVTPAAASASPTEAFNGPVSAAADDLAPESVKMVVVDNDRSGYTNFTDDSTASASYAAENQRPELSEGSTGRYVVEMQRAMNLLCNCALAEDGVLGPASVAAIEWLEWKSGLEPTGVVDDEVWALLGFDVASAPETVRQADLACGLQAPTVPHPAHAVTVQGNYNARAVPAMQCDLQWNVNNTVVTYLGNDTSGDWAYIRDQEGREAWISSAAFTKPEPATWGDDRRAATRSDAELGEVIAVVLEDDNGNLITRSVQASQALTDTYEAWGNDRIYEKGDKIGYRPLPTDSAHRSARQALLGPTGRDAAGRLKAVKWAGRTYKFAGVIMVAGDGFDRYKEEALGTRILLTSGRTIFVSAAGVAGGAAATLCGPAVWICVVPFSLAGEKAGEFMWDNAAELWFDPYMRGAESLVKFRYR